MDVPLAEVKTEGRHLQNTECCLRHRSRCCCRCHMRTDHFRASHNADRSSDPLSIALTAQHAGENDSILDTVECYSPAAGKWRSCKPLNLARSSLALLPLCA